MKYVLEKVNTLINETIDPDKINMSGSTEKNLQELSSFALSEKEDIKKNLISEAFTMNKQKQVKLFIENNQASLIQLSDISMGYVNSCNEKQKPKQTEALKRFYCSITEHLTDLLFFIERNFKKYFNEDLQIPLLYKNIAVKEFSEQVKMIRNQCLLHSTENQLLTIALLPVEKFITEDKCITFRQLYYLKELMYELFQIDTSTCSNNANELLSDTLFSLNFNSKDFVDYITLHINADIQDLQTSEDQIEKLNWHLKMNNLQHIRPSMALHPSLNTVKDQVAQWIEKELFITGLKHKSHSSSELSNAPQEFKLNISISVAVLGFLIKLLIAAGIITNTNHSEIIRFFAKHCRTSKQEDISFESLYNKYHVAGLGAVNITKELLRRLVNLIDKIA
ncbi:MAG TPA: hypothetical protein PLA68_05990 [Panacibacter sp.]|nr:hypothetical protein [Panacibacter sp.]